MSSSHNCFRLWEFFSTIWCISGVASFLDNPNAIISEYYSFSTFNSCSPNLTGASFKYSLISSWSLRSLVSNSLKYLHSFSNSYRWFTPLLRSFSIRTVVRSRFLFLRHRINSFIHSFFSIPPVVPSIPSQVCAISLLILSTGISSVPNPLLVINWIWWRIRIP